MVKLNLDLDLLAKNIVAMAYNSYTNVIVGNAPQCVHDLYNRYQDVRIGDLVVELSTALMCFAEGRCKYRSALDAVGYLLRVTQEPVVFSGDPDFVWDEAVEGCPHPTERCVYIRTLDGREFRWTNASFISAPTEYPIRAKMLDSSSILW
jgi:hypothetical protein